MGGYPGIPKQRKPGKTGGAGGHGNNMHRAQMRDSAKKDGCAVAALALAGGLLGAAGLGVWGVTEAVKAMVS